MDQRTDKQSSGGGMMHDEFLRSINIVFDAENPERIAHFHPTQKSIALVKKLLALEGERAFLVVAPYGSGKSLIGAYALHTIENRKDSRPVLKSLEQRTSEIDPSLGKWQRNRIPKWSQKGLVITLHGFSPDLVRQILLSARESLERLGEKQLIKPIKDLLKNDSIDLLDALAVIKECVRKAKLDRVVVLWDEFGRHLESLISEGRSAELNDLQTLAEFAARQKAVPYTLSLFLHQGFLSYASSLPQTIRREWKKIEGRFVTIDYVEDSKELYRLIGEIVSSRFEDHKKSEPKKIFSEKAGDLLKAGRFPGFTKGELANLLQECQPLTPSALELLPRISARISQNERTLFNFLFEIPLDAAAVGPEAIYDYFSEQMQADVDVGGTHRQWIETESALSKVSGDGDLEKVLKTTCLLSLGLAGERTRATKDQVALAVAGYHSKASAAELINELVDRKLLIHRHHSDEVAVWHGADMDLRGRLAEEKLNQAAGFDLVGFLSKHSPAPTWKPQEYNDEYSIRRYFTGCFLSVSHFEEQVEFLRSEILRTETDEDGKVIYLLATTEDEVRIAETLVQQFYSADLFPEETSSRIVFALPPEPLPLQDAALEVACLTQMEQDKELTAEDPLILPEIQQMLDDSRGHLQQLVDRLTIPGGAGAFWYYQGEGARIGSSRILRRFLSRISKTVYPLTPKIRSEVIVRKKPSPVIVNSRKKLLLALLERDGQESFGIEGNFPDAAMCRTVLVQTGLYRQEADLGKWGFAAPHAVDDPGLQKIWEIIEDFFTAPSDEAVGKDPGELFERLVAPPFGVRAGLFPIFFAAGLKAFAFTTSLVRDGEYVSDILPSDIELLCKEPHRHRLRVLTLTPDQISYLRGVRNVFSSGGREVSERDLVRSCHEAIQAWLQSLPPAALSSRRLERNALRFRKLLTRHADPVSLLLHEIPDLFGETLEKLLEAQLCSLVGAKEKIENIIAEYRSAAGNAIRLALKAHHDGGKDLRAIARNWSESFLPILPQRHPHKAVLVRMQTDYDSEAKLIESLTAVLSRVSISRWEDDDLVSFTALIREAVDQVESDCLEQANLREMRGTNTQEPVANLLETRIRDYALKLSAVLGKQEGAERLSKVLEENGKELQS